ncbi:uncharacterized protein LOC135837487 [Planococcus citri]|uniref:uncharacterized protein LOC135837487 n=1 Tax=Planococcus citri TaxID=170843 RepID=UPI0031F8070D
MQENQNCQNAFAIPDVKNQAVKEIFQLLNAGETKFCNLRELDEATLILGNTGVGKTIFTQRIVGYEASLQSVEDGLDYTIIKTNNNEKNDKSFITSDTVFPEQFKDNSTGAVYYDLPGFLDTRGAANDITTTYFIKKIVDNVKRVRMLLLINHTSLTNTGTRDDFILLLLHVTKFVKNIDKYKDGIVLIATKVQYPQKSDENVISSIAAFIKKAKNDLQQKPNSNVYYTNVIKLLDILLQQDGNTYPKIAISRSPDQKGLLSEIPIVQENIKKLKNMLSKMKFIEKNNSDFGYIIPKKSLIDIDNIMDEIGRNAAASAREISKEVQKYLSAEEERFYDISKLYNLTSTRHDELQKLKEKSNNHREIEKCVREVDNGAASMNITSVNQKKLITYGDYLSFLHEVSDHAINNEFKCADGLQDVLQFSYRSKKWYHFLNKLYERLSGYEIQSDTLNSPCSSFADHVLNHIESKKNSEFKIDLVALKKCYPNYESEFEDIKSIIVDKPKLEALGKVLRMTLKINLSCTCDHDKLVIKGQYVKIGDVPNIQKAHCIGKPKFTEIFALNEIFINEDLDKTGAAQLSIVAPVWNIQGTRRITLDGESAKAHYSATASDGTGLGDRGTDGSPGLPGGPAGNFFGLGDTFKSLQGLTISVRGGNGGPGQNGGDGLRGRDGADAQDYVRISKDVGDAIGNVVSLGLLIRGTPKSDKYKILKWNDNGSDYEILVGGEHGQKGGDGGDGGAHGLGGNPGEIKFFSLASSDTNDVQKVRGVGSNGSDGVGGKGAAGGKDGNHLRVDVPWLLKWFRSVKKWPVPIDSRADNGDRGRDGYNTVGRKYPEHGENFSDPWNIVNEYKNYAGQNLEHSVRELFLMGFLRKLENDARFQNHHRQRRNINRSDSTQIIHHKNALRAKHIRISRTLKAITLSNKKSIDEIENTPNSQNLDTNKINRVIVDDFSPAKNAGVRINSPINFAVNFVSNFFGKMQLLQLFSFANIMNYGLAKSNIEFMFSGSKPSHDYTNTEGNTNHVMKPGNFNINESLVLANFAIRCVTKQKFYNSEEKSMDLSEVRASVLNIITAFEEILCGISAEYNLPPESLEFDPVTLISKLEREIINKNYENVGEIMYQTIDSNVYLDHPQSHVFILSKLHEILEKQKHDFEARNTQNDDLTSHNASNGFRMEIYDNCNMKQIDASPQNFEQITAFNLK